MVERRGHDRCHATGGKDRASEKRFGVHKQGGGRYTRQLIGGEEYFGVKKEQGGFVVRRFRPSTGWCPPMLTPTRTAFCCCFSLSGKEGQGRRRVKERARQAKWMKGKGPSE